MFRPNALPGAMAASLALHLSLIATGAFLVWRAMQGGSNDDVTTSRSETVTIEIERLELPRIRGNSDDGEVIPAETEVLEKSAGAFTPRPDQSLPGRGGDGRSREQALALSDSVDGLTLSPDPANFDRADQVHRIHHSNERRSSSDRRATPSPTEWTFLASGQGSRLERREPNPEDPASGAPRGGMPGAISSNQPIQGFDDAPDTRTALGTGAVVGIERSAKHREQEYRRSASVAWVRPAVRSGPASVPTQNRGRTTDTVDSEQQVASAIQALMTASSAGGDEAPGVGGVDYGGAPASGGIVGAGFSARARGDSGTGDTPRVFGMENYAESVTRQVYPYWEEAMPLWARLEGRGGMAIVSVTIHANGSVRDVHIIRPSGIAEFDRNVQQALFQAAPYKPLPRALQRSGVRLHIAFDAMNPVVGRSGPGPGRRN